MKTSVVRSAALVVAAGSIGYGFAHVLYELRVHRQWLRDLTTDLSARSRRGCPDHAQREILHWPAEEMMTQ